jgi:hypothetical protein
MSSLNGILLNAVLIFIGLGVLYLLITTFNAYRRLSAFQGPPIARISNLWVLIQTLRGRLHLATAEVLKAYGRLPVSACPTSSILRRALY